MERWKKKCRKDKKEGNGTGMVVIRKKGWTRDKEKGSGKIRDREN